MRETDRSQNGFLGVHSEFPKTTEFAEAMATRKYRTAQTSTYLEGSPEDEESGSQGRG
jgi:hypothetical protein